MRKSINREGQKYGKLLALKLWEGEESKYVKWLCVCDCGTFKVVAATTLASSVKTGKNIGCGCGTHVAVKQSNTKHGLCKSKEYNSWRGMKERCETKTDSHYPLYGERGISFPEEWKSFENFIRDMGLCPDGKQLDRINVNENYSKENCRWVDKTIQAFNIRKKKNNTSGRTGVRQRENGIWYAKISYYKNVLILKPCNSYEDACIAREFAELCLYGFIKE